MSESTNIRKPLYDYSLCGQCGGSGTVLGIGRYNYEPCPKCRARDRATWEAQQAAEKLKGSQ